MKNDKKDVSEREKALKMAMENIEHRFGKGSIMKFGDSLSLLEAIPSLPVLWHWI